MYSQLELGREDPHWSGLLYEWITTVQWHSFTSSYFYLRQNSRVAILSF